jgi:AraC-like DNA-binding protein
MSGESNESDRWRGQSAYFLPIRGARCDQPNRGLTPVYQRGARAFKRSTLLAPYRWLSEEGVKHARALLTDTARKFTEIASAWSFADQVYFSGVFSASTSVTPQSFQAGEPTRSQRSTEIKSGQWCSIVQRRGRASYRRILPASVIASRAASLKSPFHDDPNRPVECAARAP